MAVLANDVLPVPSIDEEEFADPAVDKGIIDGAVEEAAWKTPIFSSSYLLMGSVRCKVKNGVRRTTRETRPMKYPGLANVSEPTLVPMASICSWLMMTTRSPLQFLLGSMFLKKLPCSVLPSVHGLGLENMDITHTLLGSIILPENRKKYEKKSAAELIRLSVSLAYESLIVEDMKRLCLAGANNKLKRWDKAIISLTNQVQEAVQAKLNLENKLGAL